MRESKKIRKATLAYSGKSIGAAALLLCFSFASEALTLGSLRGPAVIGRPLDITIPVQVEQNDDAAASCFEAEVFHADVRQPATRVRLLVEPTGTAQSIQVRVLSDALVNEPVVTVVLRARCGLKAERRYVLLADLPKGVDLGSPIQIGSGSVASKAAASSVISPAVAPKSAPLPPLIGTETPLLKPRKAVRPATVDTKRATASSGAKRGGPVPKRAEAPSGQSRLLLDNSELFSDRISLLDVDQPDAADDYVSPDQQRVQEMQETVATLQAAAAQNEASLQSLTARLKQSETERFPAWLVYLLAGLFLAAVAAMAVLWGRQRRIQAQDGEWWGASVVSPDSTAPPVAEKSRSVPLVPAPAPVVKPAVKPNVEKRFEKALLVPPASQWHESKNHGVDVNEVEMGESRFNHFLVSGEVPGTSYNASAAAPLDLVLPESVSEDPALIAELRQQAEFFVALGQTDQAVIVLEKSIQDSEVPNPHVFLDLLGLLHSLSKKLEFQHCRDAFNRLFNGVAPEFVRFKSEGRSLESYPAVLADVVAHWATPEALDCINAYVVRRPHQAPGTALDLAAFRELLLLQAISQQYQTEQADHLGEPSASLGRVMPSVAPIVGEPDRPASASMMALDLDLSEGDNEVDSGPADLGDGAPVTIPTGLKEDNSNEGHSLNMIDFDMPDVVKPVEPDGKS